MYWNHEFVIMYAILYRNMIRVQNWTFPYFVELTSRDTDLIFTKWHYAWRDFQLQVLIAVTGWDFGRQFCLFYGQWTLLLYKSAYSLHMKYIVTFYKSTYENWHDFTSRQKCIQTCMFACLRSANICHLPLLLLILRSFDSSDAVIVPV